MRSTVTHSALSSLRLFLMAAVFLGPFAGLALYKAEHSENGGKVGFVLLMSMKRGNIG